MGKKRIVGCVGRIDFSRMIPRINSRIIYPEIHKNGKPPYGGSTVLPGTPPVYLRITCREMVSQLSKGCVHNKTPVGAFGESSASPIDIKSHLPKEVKNE